MTKKGFTLIELLAVIIILAIVALIATPIVLDVIEDARISAGRSEANIIYNGINNYCINEEMAAQLDPNYTRICTSSMNKDKVKDMVNLGNATVDELVYNGEKLTTLVITSNNHTFTLCPSGTFAMDDEECGVIIEKVKDLVYENGTCKTDGSTYQYMGGCYIKGKTTNNYIWYSGFLWRIMGINADGTVRMITEENVTAIPFHENSSNWDESYAKDWLNNYFYPRLKGNDIIVDQVFCSEAAKGSATWDEECPNDFFTEPAKVGLITLDEFNLAGSSISYLINGQMQWAMTPSGSSGVWGIRDDGYKYHYNVALSAFGLRAVINIYPNVTITGGNGNIGENWSSQLGPYILNEDKNVKVNGKLNEKATSGEYVLFAEKKYRVVDKDSNGNTKLILDGYYEAPEGTVYKMLYNSNNTFSTTTGIGQILNTDVLNWLVLESDTTNRNKLVSDYKWYQNNFDDGYDYKVSLNEEDPTRSIQATVGLIRVGEMLSGQSSSILTKGYTTISSGDSNATNYWTITPYTNIYKTWYISYAGIANYNKDAFTSGGLRAVIVVNSDVIITEGNGTWSNPYQI